MFSLDEKVVYPGHGVAKINRLIEKKIAGVTTQFFELKFVNKDMTILVPVNNMQSVGIRPLSSRQNINDLCAILMQAINYTHIETCANWNKLNKEYQGKIRTGDLREICTIYRNLKYIEQYKELSFGEKNILQQTEHLLIEEIALVHNMSEAKALDYLLSLVQTALQSSEKAIVSKSI